MQQRRIAHRRHLAALKGGSVMALALASPLAAPASAQQAGPAAAAPSDTPAATADQGEVTPEVTVTGSRIRRHAADNVGPLLTITGDDLAKSGAPSVGDVLQRLPSAGVSLNSNGTQGTSYGASSINLRYLGGAEGSGNRVLVLVDGHRWVDAVGQRGFRDFVDLNTLPLGLLGGVGVL